LPGYSNDQVKCLKFKVPKVKGTKMTITCFRPVFSLSYSCIFFSACSSSLNIYDKLSDTEYTSSDYRIIPDRWT